MQRVQAELQTFVTDVSDFGFEMSVLSILRQMGFACRHSGTYEDPVTQKIREFDLRADKADDRNRLLLAVECKNIRTNLLVSAVPRTSDEAFHNIIKLRQGSVFGFRELLHIEAGRSVYKIGDMVGKRTDQVVWKEDKLVSDDSTTFDKINQAISSSHDLVKRALYDASPPFLRAVLPVLVIPSGILWQVNYDQDGRVIQEPHRVKETTVFRDHTWSVTYDRVPVPYRISHLHIVTADHLKTAAEHWLGSEGFVGGVSLISAKL